MPNWVKNKLIITSSGEDYKKIIELVKSDNRDFDFEKIIPMPENIYRGGIGPSEEAIYGENTWYSWSINNWGTKWNSNNSQISSDGDIVLETAWSTPEKVFVKLSELFPDVEFEIQYADEDIGSNCGKYVIINGNATEDYDIGNSENFAHNLWYNEY